MIRAYIVGDESTSSQRPRPLRSDGAWPSCPHCRCEAPPEWGRRGAIVRPTSPCARRPLLRDRDRGGESTGGARPGGVGAIATRRGWSLRAPVGTTAPVSRVEAADRRRDHRPRCGIRRRGLGRRVAHRRPRSGLEPPRRPFRARAAPRGRARRVAPDGLGRASVPDRARVLDGDPHDLGGVRGGAARALRGGADDRGLRSGMGPATEPRGGDAGPSGPARRGGRVARRAAAHRPDARPGRVRRPPECRRRLPRLPRTRAPRRPRRPQRRRLPTPCARSPRLGPAGRRCPARPGRSRGEG